MTEVDQQKVRDAIEQVNNTISLVNETIQQSTPDQDGISGMVEDMLNDCQAKHSFLETSAEQVITGGHVELFDQIAEAMEEYRKANENYQAWATGEIAHQPAGPQGDPILIPEVEQHIDERLMTSSFTGDVFDSGTTIPPTPETITKKKKKDGKKKKEQKDVQGMDNDFFSSWGPDHGFQPADVTASAENGNQTNGLSPMANANNTGTLDNGAFPDPFKMVVEQPHLTVPVPDDRPSSVTIEDRRMDGEKRLAHLRQSHVLSQIVAPTSQVSPTASAFTKLEKDTLRDSRIDARSSYKRREGSPLSTDLRSAPYIDGAIRRERELPRGSGLLPDLVESPRSAEIRSHSHHSGIQEDVIGAITIHLHLPRLKYSDVENDPSFQGQLAAELSEALSISQSRIKIHGITPHASEIPAYGGV